MVAFAFFIMEALFIFLALVASGRIFEAAKNDFAGNQDSRRISKANSGDGDGDGWFVAGFLRPARPVDGKMVGWKNNYGSFL